MSIMMRNVYNISSSPPKTLTALKCNCKEEHHKCGHLNGGTHSFTFHPDLKRRIPDPSGIKKITKHSKCQISL